MTGCIRFWTNRVVTPIQDRGRRRESESRWGRSRGRQDRAQSEATARDAVARPAKAEGEIEALRAEMAADQDHPESARAGVTQNPGLRAAYYPNPAPPPNIRSMHQRHASGSHLLPLLSRAALVHEATAGGVSPPGSRISESGRRPACRVP